MDTGSVNIIYNKWLTLPVDTASGVPKLDRALEAKQAYLKRWIDRADFSNVLSWVGFSGLDIVEILEDLEPLIDKSCPVFSSTKYRVINGELCSIQTPLQ